MPKVTLFDYQRKAVNQLDSGKILIGGVGSGKSITGIAFYMENYAYLPLYIITTAKKRNDNEWYKDLTKYCLEVSDDKFVTVDSWNNIHKYIDVKNAFFIFDEQRVVGYGKWSKSFIKIARNNKWILMTATPGDSWMDYMPSFIAAGFYKNKSDFIHQHVIYDSYVTKFPKIKKFCNVKKLIDCQRKMTVVMDYKTEALIYDYFVDCEYDSAKEEIIYRRRWNPFEECPIENPAQLCYLMRKNVNNDYSRLSKLYELHLKIPKIIVFYNFDFELESLIDMCEEEGFNYAQYNGHQHDEIPKTPEWLYLVQYSAGAEGWNCIETNVIVFFSQTYSYKQLKQSKGRVDRLNTPFEKLEYYHFISKSKIDKSIMNCLLHKKDFNSRMLWS